MQFYIETERLIMRDLLPSDDEGMFKLDSDADVHKYVGKRPVKTIDESRAVIEFIRAQYTTNGIGRWAVIEKSTGNFIGWSGLKLMKEPVNGRVNYYDLGYRFIKEYWGKGYATETALASVKYAWDVLQIKEVCGMAEVANTASCHVLAKAGMLPGNTFYHDGEEHIWYSIKRAE